MSFAYVGTELDVFALAENWKRYYGSFSRLSSRATSSRWAPGSAPRHARSATGPPGAGPASSRTPVWREGSARRSPPAPCPAVAARRPRDVSSLPAEDLYDTILYIDVLEHIADDRAELAAAALHLKPGGRLAVLSPAHAWLFTPFDAAIGHHRRYTRKTLAALAPPSLVLERLDYLDSAGLLLSLGNRLFLKSAHPTAAQILLWDRRVVPVSRVLDPLLLRRAGKSVLGIWRRGGEEGTRPAARLDGSNRGRAQGAFL